MKKHIIKFISIIVVCVFCTGTFICTMATAFDVSPAREETIAESVSVKKDGFIGQKKINQALNTGNKTVGLMKKGSTAAPSKGKTDVFSFIKDLFNKIAEAIKSVFSKTPSKQTTTKKTTTKKRTTTTTKKTTTTTKKRTTTTTKKTTTTTRKTTATTKKTTTAKKTTAVSGPVVINDTAFLNAAANTINSARRSAGLSSLKVDSGMSKAAAVRAKELSKSFGHTRPDGRKSYTVYVDCGLTKPSAVAENIAAATRFDGAADIVNLWLSSSDHRKNIVSSKYTRFGMAWYKTGNGKEYAVMLLGNG